MAKLTGFLRASVLGAYNAACILSLSGLLAAFAALVFATRGDIEAALVGLMLAGLADLFDGVLARSLKRDEYEKTYGIQLDTVVDVVAFVATPAVIALHAISASWAALMGMAFFVVAGVVRLAHFNTLNAMGVDQSTHHRGLPVTYSALLFPVLFLARDSLPVQIFPQLLASAFPVIGLLFVADIPIRKPSGVFYVLLPLLAAALIAYWSWRRLQ